jgi:hypothetical protein
MKYQGEEGASPMKKMTLISSLMILAFGLSANAKLRIEGVQQPATIQAPAAGDDQHISEFFGNVQLNMSDYRSWKITNTGDTEIQFLEMNLQGMMYSGSTNCPETLAAGAKCEISIRFSPFTEGYHSGYLDVIVNEGGNMYFDFWGYGVR